MAGRWVVACLAGLLLAAPAAAGAETCSSGGTEEAALLQKATVQKHGQAQEHRVGSNGPTSTMFSSTADGVFSSHVQELESQEPALVQQDYPAVEQLLFEIPAANLDSFFIAAANTWAPFHASVPGYGGEIHSYNAEEASHGGNVTVSVMIFWESFEAWKSIPSDELDVTNQAFVSQYGSNPIKLPQPNNNGWRVYPQPEPEPWPELPAAV